MWEINPYKIAKKQLEFIAKKIDLPPNIGEIFYNV